MSTYLTRSSDYHEPKDTDQSFTTAGTDPHVSGVHWGEHQPYVLKDPGYTGRFEIKEDVETHKAEWNGFQHYKVIGGRSDSSIKVRSADSVGAYPPNGNADPPRWWWESDIPAFLGYAGIYGSLGCPNGGLPALYTISGIGDVFNIPAPDDLDYLLESAHKALIPAVKSRLSLLNSLYELKDFKHLSNTFRNVAEAFRAVDSQVRAHRASGRSMKSITRGLGDVYLQYKFNLKPLYADIRGLLKAFHDYQRAAMRLVSQSEKAITRHFSMLSYPGSTTVEESPVDLDFKIQGHRTFVNRRRVVLEPIKFHVEWEYSYYYTSFQKQNAALFAALDALGVNLNPSIIWNAIPWSFVVDWVVGISNALDRFKLSNLEPVVYVHRALWSVSRTRSIHIEVDTDTSQKGVPVGKSVETAYRRSRYSPGDYSSVRTSGISLSEASLIAALVSTRRPRAR